MSTLTQPITIEDHIQGVANAPAVCVVYGDYQCPYTRRAMTHIKALQRRLGDQLCFVYRHFPAPPDIHPHARAATEIALAADTQGKFWEMHYLLFRQQKALANENLLAYAAQLGLDMDRINQETAVHTYQARMWRDLQSGWDSGVRGAPALFINGTRYKGGPTMAEMLSAIEPLLKPTG